MARKSAIQKALENEADNAQTTVTPPANTRKTTGKTPPVNNTTDTPPPPAIPDNKPQPVRNPRNNLTL